MMTTQKKKVKNFRKRIVEEEEDPNPNNKLRKEDDEDEEQRRMVLEEIKLLQKLRERKSGIPAFPSTTTSASSSASGLNSTATVNGISNKVNINGDKNNDAGDGGGGGGGGEKEELVLQDTFALETAVLVEDPNMVRYVEQELAKKRGKNITATDQNENDIMRADDELYKIPEHLKVKERNSEESSTQWTTGIAEIQLPIEYKLRNIEETEAAKKLLQDKRLAGRTKTESSIPSSYSADYFQRGRDYAEKLRKENPEVYKAKDKVKDTTNDSVAGLKETDTTTTTSTDAAKRRETATDQIMLERFRKRERHRVMRR